MFNRYFKRSEFMCRCGCFQDIVDYELVVVLTEAREHFLKPITIESGYRCIAHNHSIGSTDRSQHVLGKAADIKVRDISPATVQAYFDSKYPNKYGLGSYKTFTHIDVRNGKGRWWE